MKLHFFVIIPLMQRREQATALISLWLAASRVVNFSETFVSCEKKLYLCTLIIKVHTKKWLAYYI